MMACAYNFCPNLINYDRNSFFMTCFFDERCSNNGATRSGHGGGACDDGDEDDEDDSDDDDEDDGDDDDEDHGGDEKFQYDSGDGSDSDDKKDKDDFGGGGDDGGSDGNSITFSEVGGLSDDVYWLSFGTSENFRHIKLARIM